MEASSSRTGSMSAALDLDANEPDIPAKLLKFEDALAAYVRDPLVLPRWPPQTTWANGPSWTDEDIDRMSSMYMPETPFGDDKPDMLLYELGNLEVLDDSFPAQLSDFVSGKDHLLLVERSGAGKTRLVFETLCRRWGLYFTCSSDPFVSPYGSDDIRLAIRHLSVLNIDEMLWPLNPRSRILRDKLHQNQATARALIAGVVRARLLVFHLFYKHAVACDLSPDVARKKWLFLQLRPHCMFGTMDIFAALRHETDEWSYEMLERDIVRLQRSSAAVLEFIALDEAQVAGRSFENAFTSPDRRSHRPLLAQLVHDFCSICHKQRLIVSGVEASHDIVQEAIEASGSAVGVRQFLGLGMFGTLERVRRYLSHFGLSDVVDCRMVHHWLSGRHRVLAVFTAYCLLSGRNRWRSVLATMVYKLTGFYELGDPLIDEVSLSPLIDSSILEGTRVAWCLRHALYMHVMHSRQTVTLDQYASDIVRLALGRYGSDTSSVLIDEQLVFLSLYHWLHESSDHTPYALFSAANNGSLRPLRRTGFLENLAMILWNAHEKQAGLGRFIQFVGSSHAWANARFALALPQFASYSFSAPAERYRPSQLVACVESPEDLHAWFTGASRPFVFPGAACGVEMLCIVQLDDDHRVLLCFETEKQLLSSLRARTRLTPTHPSAFYAQDPGARERWKRYWAQITHSLPAPRLDRVSKQPTKLSVVHVLCYAQPQNTLASSKAQVAVLSHDYLRSHADIDLELSDIVQFQS